MEIMKINKSGFFLPVIPSLLFIILLCVVLIEKGIHALGSELINKMFDWWIIAIRYGVLILGLLACYFIIRKIIIFIKKII